MASELSTFLLLTSLTVMILSAIFAIGTLYLETGKIYSSITSQPAQIMIKDLVLEDKTLKILVYNHGTSSLILSQDSLNIHIIFYGSNFTEYNVYRSWSVNGKKINAFELLPASEVELEIELGILPPEHCLIDVIVTSGETRVEWSKRF
ncbi:MAG: hypothetical protein N3F64_03690 [Nitrososphaeria archaeon]|nr:hypothetical protein [Nitrososphaeria archaeon]